MAESPWYDSTRLQVEHDREAFHRKPIQGDDLQVLTPTAQDFCQDVPRDDDGKPFKRGRPETNSQPDLDEQDGQEEPMVLPVTNVTIVKTPDWWGPEYAFHRIPNCNPHELCKFVCFTA